MIIRTLLLLSTFLTGLNGYAQSSRKMTLMFYLDNQNGDHVDAYVSRVQEKISYYSQVYSKLPIQWVAISSETNSRNLRDQRLVVKTYTNGNAKSIKELNAMAFSSPETLNQFTEEGLKLGSELNVLIMVDHGFGDEGIMSTDLVTERGREVKGLRNLDVASSIVKAENKAGKKLDLLILDACLMGSIEALSDFLQGGLKTPVVTSENTTLPTNGGANYDRFFSSFAQAKKANLTAIELGQWFVTANQGNSAANFSLIDLKAIPEKMIFEQFQSMQADLKKIVTKNRDRIIESLMSRNPSPGIQGGVYDLQILIETFERFSKDNPALLQKLTNLRASLKQIILATESDNSETKETGLSIRLSIGGMNPGVVQQRLKNYSNLSFPQKTKWNEIIQLFLSQ